MPYSTRFAAVTLSAAAPALYTVPEGYTAVIRDMELTNQTGAPVSFAVDVTVPGPLTATMYYNGAFPAASWVQWTGRVVLNAGDILGASAGAYPVGLVVSGYLLSSP